MSSDGRKLLSHNEHILDNLIIEFVIPLNKYVFYPLGFTPNTITFLALMFGLASVWALYKHHFLLFSTLWLVSYMLDCADGNFARMYNMTSQGGDLFDHISDTIKGVAFFIVFITLPDSFLSRKEKIIWTGVIFLCTIGALIHMGCQEQLYNTEESPSLSALRKLCPKPQYIKWTRHAGIGLIIIVIFFAGIVLHFKQKSRKVILLKNLK